MNINKVWTQKSFLTLCPGDERKKFLRNFANISKGQCYKTFLSVIFALS